MLLRALLWHDFAKEAAVVCYEPATKFAGV